jgi:eukaryotic-like serine/threonine-protein kinase
MPIESTTTHPNWGSLQGVTLEGGYELTEIVSADETAAIFKVRVLGDYLRKSMVKLFRAAGEAAEEQLSIWGSLKYLQHANLSSPQDVGRTQLEGNELIYIVLGRPDETLGSVLQQRSLTINEASEVLQSLTKGLDHLHAHGFVHGCLSPPEVLAFGDSIRLSTECVRRINTESAIAITTPKYVAPERAGENITPAADVWCLGATLYEALLRKDCTTDSFKQAADLPAPFGRIVQRCLEPDPQIRAKLFDIPAFLREASVPAIEVKATAAVGDTSVQRPPSVQRSAPGSRSAPVTKPARPKPAPGAGPARPIHAALAKGQMSRMWIYVAVAVLVFFGVIWLAHPKRHVLRGLVPKSAAQSTQKEAAGGTRKAWPTQTLSPDSAPPPAAAPTTRAQAPAQPTNGAVNGPVWRVVVYTYQHQQDAENKAKSINEKYAGLGAEVFSPKGNRAPYLVVIGGQMNHDEALRLRRRAVGLGLPHDSYMQNFRQ